MSAALAFNVVSAIALVMLAAERWIRRQEESRRVIEDRIDGLPSAATKLLMLHDEIARVDRKHDEAHARLEREIEGLHQKASDYGDGAQERFGRIFDKLARYDERISAQNDRIKEIQQSIAGT